MASRLWRICLYLVIGVWLPGCDQPHQLPREAGITIRAEESQSSQAIDLFLLIDESGSMVGQHGTDPAGLRHDAGRYLIQNLMIKKSTPNEPHQVAVIHFGDQAEASTLIPVLPANARTLAQKVPWTTDHLGDTSFIQALRAIPLVETQTRERKIVLFTDGVPDDSRRHQMSQDDYFAEIAQRMAHELTDCALYVVGIDKPNASDHFARTVEQWKQIAGADNVFAIQQLHDLYTSFNEAVRSIFEIPSIIPDRISEDRTFEVQPYLDQLEFHLFTPSQMQVEIHRPDGRVLQAEDHDVTYYPGDEYDLLVVNAPTAGQWKYRITSGQGQVSVVFRNPIPFRLAITEPGTIFPLGKPMQIRARFAKENGEEVEEVPEYPLAFVAKVTTPEDVEHHLQFPGSRRWDGLYHSDALVPTEQPGEYHIELVVKGGHRFQTSHTETIFVQSYPYLQPQQPKQGESQARSSHGLACRTQLLREGKPTDPTREFEDNPNTLVLAQIIGSSSGYKSPAIWLDYDADTQIFGGFIPMQLPAKGHVTLAYQLQGEPRVPSQLIPSGSVEIVRFELRPNWQDRVFPYLIGLAALILCYLILLSLWLFRGRTIMASLDVATYTGQTQTVFLNNKKRFWPRQIQGYTADNGTNYPTLTFWGRARTSDALRVFIGGWASILSFGLLSQRKANLIKGQEYEIRPGYRFSLN